MARRTDQLISRAFQITSGCLKKSSRFTKSEYTHRVHNPNHPGIGSQVDKMRAEIRQHGECCVGSNELSLLCPNEVSNAEELNGISEIAE